MKNAIKKIFYFFNLDAELEDKDIIYVEIMKGSNFKGTNLWILMFAIIIASVGLNMNSTAVIIGAMLISPLMGPINGIGYSLATYDLDLLRKAVKNFNFAILASLLASTTYFALTPITTAYSELLARTTPSIYDVLIATFGGLAGIVAISSKNKGNVIPGVAIATALMPPLCTAGYGIATGQYNFFFGAIYLFTINTIFIAFASVMVSRILKFPIRSILEDDKKRKINRIISVIIIIVIIPSIYFGNNLVQQENFIQKANLFIKDISNYDGNFLLKSKIDGVNRKIYLVYGGTDLTEQQKSEIISKLNIFDLTKAEIVFEKGLTFSQFDESNKEVYKLKEQIAILNQQLSRKKNQLDSIENSKRIGNELLKEIKALYPNIIGCSVAESYFFTENADSSQKYYLVSFKFNKSLTKNDELKIQNWVSKRLKTDSVMLFFTI